MTVSFWGEGSPTEKDYSKKGTLILTSLLEDLGVKIRLEPNFRTPGHLCCSCFLVRQQFEPWATPPEASHGCRVLLGCFVCQACLGRFEGKSKLDSFTVLGSCFFSSFFVVFLARFIFFTGGAPSRQRWDRVPEIFFHLSHFLGS